MELLEMLNDYESEPDQIDYEWALEQYQNCEESFEFNDFAIFPDQLEIIESCYMPNAIKFPT